MPTPAMRESRVISGTRALPTTSTRESRITSGGRPTAPASIDVEARSVEVTAATETPVEMFDWLQFLWVPEVLLMSGVELPSSIPMLDTHSQSEIKNILGSARDFRVAEDQLVARVYFASEADAAWSRVLEGHLDSVSIGYQFEDADRVFVGAGASAVVGGRTFLGPVNVVTRWRLIELSWVAIGADPNAKVRSKKLEKSRMSPRLRAALVAHGMPANATDEQAEGYLDAHYDALFPASPPPETRSDTQTKIIAPPSPTTSGVQTFFLTAQRSEPSAPIQQTRSTFSGQTIELVAEPLRMSPPTEDPETVAKRVYDERVAAERKRAADISAMCQRHGFTEMSRALIDGGATISAAQEAVLEAIAKRSPIVSPSIVAGPAEFDKRVEPMRWATRARFLRQMGASQRTRERFLPDADKPPAGAADFQNISLIDLARECCEAEGLTTRGMSRTDIAIAAMGFRNHVLNYYRAAGTAWHTSGTLANIVYDAANVSLLAAFNEAPVTWRTCFRQAPSVSDFKTIHRVQLSDAPNIDVWNGTSAPKELAMLDRRAYYGIEAYSNNISYGYHLIVNDDLDALSKTPIQLGRAMARTINASVWSIITGNPTLEDGVALFSTATGNRQKSNYTSPGAAPSVAQLQTNKSLMRQQVGPNGAILNIEPRYIIGPSALETTIEQLVLSAYDPAATLSMVYNPSRTLIPVIEPLLDAASSNDWFLAADPNSWDTIEVTFLQGQEEPQIRTWMDERSLAMNFSILQSFGAKAIDSRGLVKDGGGS